MEENNINVPYKHLREYAKNHRKTKKLVQEFREENHEAYVYLSLIDSDTINFNGIYSAYLRIVKDHKVVPTVMSTGYEYLKPGYQFASQIDRQIRVTTAKHIPLGVYYPEPNTCVLIQQGSDTVQESFIKTKTTKGNLESACLIKEIKKRKNATFIFSGDNPLITTVPDRAKLTETCSPEFAQGASPKNKKDLKHCKKVPQSSLHEFNWLTSLFINGAIEFIKYDFNNYEKDPKLLQNYSKLLETARNEREQSENRNRAIDVLKQHIPSDVVDVKVRKRIFHHSFHLISIILNSEQTTTEWNEAMNELKKYVIPNVVDAIVKATNDVKQDKKLEKHVRSKDENKLLVIFKEYNIKISSFSREEILMLSQKPILNLIEKKIIKPQVLIGLDIEILKCICYDEDIIEMLENKTRDFDRVLKLLKKHFSENMEAREKYSFSDIFNRYEENALKN